MSVESGGPGASGVCGAVGPPSHRAADPAPGAGLWLGVALDFGAALGPGSSVGLGPAPESPDPPVPAGGATGGTPSDCDAGPGTVTEVEGAPALEVAIGAVGVDGLTAADAEASSGVGPGVPGVGSDAAPGPGVASAGLGV